MDRSERRRTALAVASLVVAALIAVGGFAFGYQLFSGLGAVLLWGPPAVGVTAALTGHGRVACLVAAIVALSVDMLLVAYGGWLFLPSAGLLLAAGVTPQKAGR